MKLLEFSSVNGQRIVIPVDKITGICGTKNQGYGKTFIATGADTPEGENGWYVAENLDEVKARLASC